MSHRTDFRNRVSQGSRLDIETAACASSNLGESFSAFQRHSPLAGKQVDGEYLEGAVLCVHARCAVRRNMPQYAI